MDREYILNCAKKFYLEHKIDDTFIELINAFCVKKEHPEHLQGLIQIINMPMLNGQIIDNWVSVLNWLEKNGYYSFEVNEND